MRLVAPLLALAMVITACAPAAPIPAAPAPPAPPTAPVERRAANQSLRIGWVFAPANMSPATALTPNPFGYWPMYDNLTMFGPDFAVKPSVARGWDVSADGLTWRFTLRTDLFWPDGTPVTAEDAAFTLNELRARRWFSIGTFAPVATAKALDATTLELTTRAPDMTIPAITTYLWIIPKAYYERVGPDGFAEKPVGSGPYELAEFRQGDLVRFTRKATPHPFRQPQNQELIFHTIPDPGQRVLALRSGDLDMVAGSSLSVEQADQLRAAGIELISNLTSVVFLTMAQGTAAENNTPLQDKRVRQALNYAVDTETIAKTIYRGQSQALGQIALPGSLYYDPSAKPYPFDPAKAKQLLAEAGYAGGFKLTLDTSTSQGMKDMLTAVQGYLHDVGVEVEIQMLEGGEYSDRAVGANNRQKGDLWNQVSGDTNGFGSTIRTFYGCDKPAKAPAAAVFYCNPEWDSLMDQAVAERSEDRRVALLHEANKVEREDVPAIFLLALSVFVAHGKDIRNVNVTMPLMYNFDSAYRVQQ